MARRWLCVTWTYSHPQSVESRPRTHNISFFTHLKWPIQSWFIKLIEAQINNDYLSLIQWFIWSLHWYLYASGIRRLIVNTRLVMYFPSLRLPKRPHIDAHCLLIKGGMTRKIDLSNEMMINSNRKSYMNSTTLIWVIYVVGVLNWCR